MIQLAKILHSRVKRFLNHCDPHVLQRAKSFKPSPLHLLRDPRWLSADSETGEDKQRISCLIDDFGWMFAQPIAQLPRLVVSEFTVSFFRSQFVLPKLRREVYLPPQDSEQEDLVQEFPPLRKLLDRTATYVCLLSRWALNPTQSSN
ncbi:unnamed protein product [Arabidopsis lyrata]|nr:unnamed protein product [Arabidopsis lyrata]